MCEILLPSVYCKIQSNEHSIWKKSVCRMAFPLCSLCCFKESAPEYIPSNKFFRIQIWCQSTFLDINIYFGITQCYWNCKISHHTIDFILQSTFILNFTKTIFTHVQQRHGGLICGKKSRERAPNAKKEIDLAPSYHQRYLFILKETFFSRSITWLVDEWHQKVYTCFVGGNGHK